MPLAAYLDWHCCLVRPFCAAQPFAALTKTACAESLHVSLDLWDM